MESAVRLTNVSRVYGLRFVLRGLDLEVLRGEAVAVGGPNGSGKTTLLKLIATLLAPTSGALELFDLPPDTDRRILRRRIGAVFAESWFYPDLTVSENLGLYARLYDLADGPAEISRWLERFRMERFSAAPVRTLSRGERQRVSLVRSLLHKPELVLWDEPFVGLDTAAREILNGVACGMKGRTTFLCVSHEAGTHEPWVDRRIALERGRCA